MVQKLLPSKWWQSQAEELAQLAPLQRVYWAPFCERNIKLSIKREDLLGWELGGNKVYKLWGHLRKARDKNGALPALASFGGAWSNHLLALAVAGKQLGVPVMAIVRGEQPREASAMLKDLSHLGTQIKHVSRSDFKRLKTLAANRQFESLNLQFGKHYWIPEGGGGVEGASALAGLRESIIRMSSTPVDVIAHACGTGTSIAGLAAGAGKELSILGVAVLKARAGLEAEVKHLLAAAGQSHALNWEIDGDRHCGGYAKLPEYLVEFIKKFEHETSIPLDPVYTAKLMYGLSCMAEQGKWRAGSHIVAIHSGGLQGRRGWACFGE